MNRIVYNGRKIEPRVRALAHGGWSVEAWIHTDSGGTLTIQQFFTDDIAGTEEEATKRAIALGRRAIEEELSPNQRVPDVPSVPGS